MRFNCKSCGTQLRIHRSYLRRAAVGILLVWFIVTLGASYFPFSNYIRVALYVVTLFAAISIFNLFVPFEEVEQEIVQEVGQKEEEAQEVEQELDPAEQQEIEQELEEKEEKSNL